MGNLIKITKSSQENIGSELFKRMPFVSFFLYALLLYFMLAAIAELYPFTVDDINWIVYNDEHVYYNDEHILYIYRFGIVKMIIGILSVINAVAMIPILKSKIKGFWLIACSCTIALFVLALYSQYFNIKYNSIGNLVLLKNLFIPFILWAVLNLKNDKGESQWQYLR